MSPGEIANELRKNPDLLRLSPTLLARDIRARYQVSNHAAHRAIYRAMVTFRGRKVAHS